jgi:lysophospholipase L1-like esterase
VGAAYVSRNVVTSIQASQQKDGRCKAETAYAAEHGSVIEAATGKTNVVIMGDSYTTGEFLPDRSRGWAYQVGQGKDWAVKLNGFGGTGFVNSGPCDSRAYSDRIAKVLALKPQVLIVEGGLNDANASPADIQAALGLS